MDPLIERMPRELLGHLNQKELVERTRLLELARHGCDEKLASPTCDGSSADAKVTCDKGAA